MSGQQAEILKTDSGFVVRDLNSTNGTLLNNKLMQAGQFYPLGHEAIIRVCDDAYGISVGFTFINPRAQATRMDGFLQTAPVVQIIKDKHVLIGRLPTSTLVLDHPEVSREHALVREVNGKYLLEDLGSSNGTFVNDKSVKQMVLHDGDMIQISKFLLLFQDGELIPYQSTGMRLDVSNLSKDVVTKNGKQRILDHISLSILPREFVAVIGGKGAGKSPLLDVLSGIRRAEGQVQLNGHDLYKNHENFRSQLGYVPQTDILPASLSVEKALEYAARLRLPANLTPGEKMSRIDAALDTVAMNTDALRKTRFADLSDEERKRVSLAAELLTDPKLIYLDEITGLDPGREKKMIHTLRRIADEGRTVVLVTQATNNILQTDHVAFLSEGKLVYFGPPEEALDFFEVEEFADIYERIDGKGEEWQQVFQEKKPAQHKKYILDRQRDIASLPKRRVPKVEFGITDLFRQLRILTQRSFRHPDP